MARLFNGTTQYARFTTPINPGTIGAFSIAAWVNCDLTHIHTAGLGQSNVVQQLDSSGTGRSLLYLLNNGGAGTDYRLASFLGGGPQMGATNLLSFDDKWLHIGLTYDGAGTLKLFAHGNQDLSVGSIVPEATAGDIVLGVAKVLTAGWFKGAIAEVGFWNVDIGVRGMRAMKDGKPVGAVRPASLLAWLPLYGQTSPEPSLRGTPGTHDATLVNGPGSTFHAPVGQIAPRALWLSDYTAIIGTTQTIELPSLGDVATINGPDVKGRYTLNLPSLGDVATINAPNIFEYLVIPLPTIGGGPVAGGLWIENAPEVEPTPTPGEPIAASDTLPDPRIRVRIVDPSTLAEIVELDEAKKRQWQTVVGDSGTGLAILENDDVDLASASYGRLLRFELDGRAVFLASIERKRQVVLSQDEEVAEETEVGGRGILALFEDFVVYPEAGAGGRPFSDQRILNWTSADFDDDGWRTVIVGQRIADVHAVDPNIAKGFPDGEARVLWAHSSTGASGAGAGGTPPGLGYFRAPSDFEVTTAGWYRLFLSADDGVTVNVDGVQIFNEARLWFHLETKWVDLYLSAGPHQISALGENLDNGNLAGNSAWILLSLISIDEDGDLGTVILRTGPDWKGVAYPPKPPGMTVGRVIRILLEEAQARGGMVGWTLGFTDYADSHGQAWEDDPELAFQCGLDGFSVLRQIAETYCEIDVAPAQKVLYAYAGGYGETTSIEFETGVSILALSHEGTA